MPEIIDVFIGGKGSCRVGAALQVCAPPRSHKVSVCVCFVFFFADYFEFECIKYLAVFQPAQVLGKKIPKVQTVFY